MVPAFFPGLLFAKVVARENFQVASRNVTREPRSFVKRVAPEACAPPTAALGGRPPRPGSQPSLLLHHHEQGARGGRGEVHPTPRPGNPSGPRRAPARPVRVLFRCGVCKYWGGENYPHLRLKVPHLKPKADFSGDNKDTLSLWTLLRCKSLIARE